MIAPYRRIEFFDQYTPEIIENIYQGSHILLDSMSNFNVGRAKLKDIHCKYDFDDFRPSHNTVISQSNSWLLNKKSPFKEIINLNLMWMQATGLINKHYTEEKGFFSSLKMDRSCHPLPSPTDLEKSTCGPQFNQVHVPIGLKHFKKLFFAYICGNICALAAFLIEIFVRTLTSWK